MRISDWSSDVCSSDLNCPDFQARTDRRRNSMVWGYIGLGDRVKNTARGARKDTAQVVSVNDRDVTIEYDDGDRVNVPIDNRSEERRVGQKCGRTWRSRGSPCQ